MVDDVAGREPPTDENAAPENAGSPTTLRLSLLALAAAVLGSAAGFVATIVSANISANAQNDVAQSNFLHNQRQIAYSAFITDISAANKSLKTYITLFESGG